MTKYGNKKVIVNGIKFDSKIEYEFYEYLLEQQKQGIVKGFDMQVPFVILEGYEMNGRKVRPVRYIADYVVYYTDGTWKVIDIKGFQTADSKLKVKMFESKYKMELYLVTKSIIDGGWITLDELAKARKLRRKIKNTNKL